MPVPMRWNLLVPRVSAGPRRETLLQRWLGNPRTLLWLPLRSLTQELGKQPLLIRQLLKTALLHVWTLSIDQIRLSIKPMDGWDFRRLSLLSRLATYGIKPPTEFSSISAPCYRIVLELLRRFGHTGALKTPCTLSLDVTFAEDA